jgi:hypothetical protein
LPGGGEEQNGSKGVEAAEPGGSSGGVFWDSAGNRKEGFHNLMVLFLAMEVITDWGAGSKVSQQQKRGQTPSWAGP